jgi:hypothetical protein
MTSKATVPSTVSQRFVNRDLPLRQPLATVFSIVAADPSTVKATVPSTVPQRLTNRHRLIFRLNTPFQAEFLGWLAAGSSGSTAASPSRRFAATGKAVMYV